MMLIKNNLIIIFIIMAIVLEVKSYAEEVWKITSLNWEPYSGAELINQGNSVQKLRELLKKQGIRLVVDFYPWKRSQAKAKTKEYIGYFPAWPEEVYEGFVASPPIDMSCIGVLKKSGTHVIFNGINKLFKTYKVGIIKIYAYPKIIMNAMKKYPYHTDGTMNEILLLRKLLKKD